MRTETIEQTIYSINDLLLPENSHILDKAIEKYRYSNANEVFYYNEMESSYNSVKKNIYDRLDEIMPENTMYGVRLYKWVINNLSWLWIDKNRISKHANGKFKNSYFAYKYDGCIKYRVSKIFVTNNLENCPFTGVCYDIDFMKPIIDFLKNPSEKISNTDLVDSMPTLQSIYDKELEWIQSDEYIIDTFQANEYEFNEDGSIY